MSMLIRAVLATAKTARNGNTRSIGKSGAPLETTSRSARPSESEMSLSSGAVSTVTTETATSMYSSTAMPRPVSMVRGKILFGSLTSSTMFTASSNPTIAKKAIDVAAVTARNRPRSS